MSDDTPRHVRSLGRDTIASLMLDATHPVRLASLSPNGFPLISTLWLLYEDDMFWGITQARTLLRRNLTRDPRCAFEIALSGARFSLMRGQGHASLHLDQGARVTERMIARYLDDTQGPVATKLRAQVPTEFAIRIEPRWVRGSGRMG